MVRTNSPRLVNPALVHDKHFAGQIGIQTPGTIGARTGELAAEKQQLTKPPVVDGTHADGSSLDSLTAALHQQGVINNQTTLGMAKAEAAPTNDPIFTGQITVLGIPSASPTYIQAGFFFIEEIDTDDATHPATIAASPVATYPGAGTGPTGVSVSGGSIAGVISLTIGGGPALGDVCRVTYGINRAATGRVVLQARTNSAAADVTKIKITGADLTGFTITAVSALSTGNVYTWNYLTF
jgi:hypothetical protein